jgi:hypothetical protein
LNLLIRTADRKEAGPHNMRGSASFDPATQRKGEIGFFHPQPRKTDCAFCGLSPQSLCVPRRQNAHRVLLTLWKVRITHSEPPISEAKQKNVTPVFTAYAGFPVFCRENN